jgi:hypothetical protein
MTFSDDLQGEMQGSWLDDDTADRLLAGLIAPDEAAPDYAQVSWIVRAATAAPSARELAKESQHVAAAARAVDLAPIAPRPTWRSATRSRFSRTRIVAAMVAATLAGTTGLAMASVLPTPAQDAISGVLAKVGISVPSSDDHPASTGEEISRIATTTDSTGVDKGAEISGIASGGMSHAGQNGAAHNAQHGAGQSGTGQDASADHEHSGGSSVGAGHSGDRSAGGSEDAPDPPAPSTSSHGSDARP